MKYQITLYADAHATYTVEANNEEEAYEKAYKEASLMDCYIDDWNGEEDIGVIKEKDKE